MVEIKNLNYKIGAKEILRDINLSIPENEIIAVIGANGCGKTTLLRSILSMCKYSGTISINNTDISTLKNKDRARLLSYLPQNCLKTNIKVATLIKHSRFPYLNYGEDLSKKDYEIIQNAIHLVGIEHLLSKNVMEISGGERQLAYLTMVLAQQTPIVLLDEPNTFLDIAHQLFLFDILRTLKANGRTVIVILHDIIQALEIADKVVVMDNGSMLDYGMPNEIIHSIEQVFSVGINEINSLKDAGFTSLYKYSLILKGGKNVNGT